MEAIIQALGMYLNKSAKEPLIKATSSVLNNPEIFEYTPYGEKVYIREVTGGSASDYDATKGFTPSGDLGSVVWSEFTAQHDRKFILPIDARKELNSIAQGMTPSGVLALERFWAKFASELDAVTYSTIYNKVKPANRLTTANYPVDGANGWKTLAKVRNLAYNSGIDGPIFGFVASSVYAELEYSLIEKNGLANPHVLTLVASTDGLEVKVDVLKYHNIFLIRVPDERLITGVVLFDGDTAGQENGGWAADAGAKAIKMLFVPHGFGGQSVRHVVTNFTVPQSFEGLNPSALMDAVKRVNEVYQGQTEFRNIGINQTADSFQYNNRIIYDTAVFKTQEPTIFSVEEVL